MVQYFYDRYGANAITTRSVGTETTKTSQTTSTLGTITIVPNLMVSGNTWDRSKQITVTSSLDGIRPYGGYYWLVSDTRAYSLSDASTSSNGFTCYGYAHFITDIITGYTRGALVQSNIVAENGTYPANGRHSDGYWYVRGALVNAVPTLTLATTDNRTLYENDQFNVTGQVTDTDVGNVVITKFSINGGTERAITSAISQGTALTYNKVLTFKQGRLFDGANAITDTLADGSQHVLRVWAEDDKGGKSAEQVRVFYVVANRSAVLTINPVTSKSDLIDSDTIAISGNVSDPDGNTVTVRYKIGNGLYTQVYSGTGGAFNFNVALADLQTGVNTVMVQATDSYGLSTTKTLRVTKSANNKPLLKSVATYKLTPPNGSADGIVLWVQRETGDLIVNAEISMSANGAEENFVPMVKAATAYVTDAIEEDEFTFDNGEVAAENIVIRLTMERTSATSGNGIKLISGVLS